MTLKLLPTITELDIKDIAEGDRLRPVSEAEVSALVELIGEFGHTTPILIRRKKTGFALVDGAHRLEATRRAGLGRIAVRVYEMTDLDQRELEASQNLTAAMSPLEDAVFLAAWRKAYQEKHPEAARGVAGALAKNGLQRNFSSFAEMVARKRGIGTRQVNKITALGEKLNREDRDTFYRSGYQPTISDLQALGKIGDSDARRKAIASLAAGEAKNAAHAIKALKPASEAPVKDPVEDQLKSLKTAWNRAGMTARRRFVAEYFEELGFLGAEEEEARFEAEKPELLADIATLHAKHGAPEE